MIYKSAVNMTLSRSPHYCVKCKCPASHITYIRDNRRPDIGFPVCVDHIPESEKFQTMTIEESVIVEIMYQ